MAFHAVREIIDLVHPSIGNWTSEAGLEDKHPEVTTLVTFHLAEWFRLHAFDLARQIFMSERDTIMVLMNSEGKQALPNRRLASARQERQKKQELRRGKVADATAKLREWRDWIGFRSASKISRRNQSIDGAFSD
jgi:hypothetical protein